MRSRRVMSSRYWVAVASMVLALVACAGANGDPAPAAVEAGAAAPAVACVDAGATE